MCKQVWVAFCNAQKHGACVHVSLKAFPYCACLKVTCSIHFPLSQLRSLLKNLERVTPYCHTSIPPRLDGALYTRVYYRRLSVSLSLIGGGLDRWAGGVQEGGVRNCDRLWQTEEEMEGEKWREREGWMKRGGAFWCVWHYYGIGVRHALAAHWYTHISFPGCWFQWLRPWLVARRATE